MTHPIDKEHLTEKSVGSKICVDLLSIALQFLKPGWSSNTEISLESEFISSNVIFYHSKLMLKIKDSVSERNW